MTGAGLSDFGNEVTCVDIDEEKISKLEAGEVPIYEPGLDTIIERNVEHGRLRFTTDLPDSIRTARAIFIAVGTPPNEDGSADLSHVLGVAESIAEHMEGPTLVITKSTVPVGTGAKIRSILDKAGRTDASVASNPEFLREGSAIEDFQHPDRVVIGAEDEDSIQVLKQIYQALHALETPFVVTSIPSAELIKYASNAFLATKVSFINEVAALAEEVGADVQDVAKGMGLDNRIGPRFLQAGPGYGGSCFPKDTRALAEIARDAGAPFEIVETVIRVNEKVKSRMVEKVVDALGGSVADKKVGILGLSFKPDTDDMRESPSVPLLRGLLDGGAQIRAYDPEAVENAKEILENRSVEFVEDAYDVASHADAVVIVTEWNEFRALDLERLGSVMKDRLLVDLRNIYDPVQVRRKGFRIVSLGRREGDELRRERR